MILALAYGLSSLAFLWASGGGNIALYWERQPLFGITLLTIAGGSAYFSGEWPRLKRMNSASLFLGAASALAGALPVALLIGITRKLGTEAAPHLLSAVELLQPPHALDVVIAACLVAPAYAVIAHGLLAPAWGLSGTSFLVALTIGFGFQKIGPFLIFWCLGYFWAFLAKQFGFTTAFWSHILWTVIVGAALLFS
jgi:hypothetical protein